MPSGRQLLWLAGKPAGSVGSQHEAREPSESEIGLLGPLAPCRPLCTRCDKQAATSGPSKKKTKGIEGQKEMLMAIEGKKPVKTEELQATAAKRAKTRRKAS